MQTRTTDNRREVFLEELVGLRRQIGPVFFPEDQLQYINIVEKDGNPVLVISEEAELDTEVTRNVQLLWRMCGG